MTTTCTPTPARWEPDESVRSSRRRGVLAGIIGLAVASSAIFAGPAALADTGGSGDGSGGTGGGSANPDRRVYLSVFDHVSVAAHPETGIPHAEQGWGADSITYFLNQARSRIQPTAGAGVFLGYDGTPKYPNGMNLEEFIADQCTKALDEATERNPDAVASRVVALQFSYQIWRADMGGGEVYTSITPAHVERALYRDTLDEVGSYSSFKLGTWSDQVGNLVADSDGDGVFSGDEYVNVNDSTPEKQPRYEINQELDRAVTMAIDAIGDAQVGMMVSCVAMNNLEPAALMVAPSIDVSKNAEDVDGVPDSTVLTEAGAQTVTVRFTNTGDDTLVSLTFADETLAGNTVRWTELRLPSGGVLIVGGAGTPADVTALLEGVELAPEDAIEVVGTVTVDADEDHIDRVTVTGTGKVSGVAVSDDDATEYLAPEAPAVLPEEKDAEPAGGDRTLAATGADLPIIAMSGALGVLALGALLLVMRRRAVRAHEEG